MPTTKPSVLFVCVHNAGKSQMAAALMRQKALDSVEVLSGGTDPGDALNEPARIAVSEVGASMDGEFPKKIARETLERVDRVIILGNEAKVDALPGMHGRIETWFTPEPGPEIGDKMAQTRIVRDDISRRVHELYLELTQH